MVDIAILGAGASGLFLASLFRDRDFILIEGNSEVGAKIKISGGKKCNITNRYLSENNYLGDREFIKKIFSKFDNRDLIKFLRAKNLELTLRDKRYYFCKNNSSEFIDLLKEEIPSKKILLKHKIERVQKIDKSFLITTDRAKFRAKKVVIATGGVSYPKVGSTDIGFKIAKEFGHRVTPLKPALVGFTVQKDEFWFKELSGVSILASVKVKDREFLDTILFTHKGISGLNILSSSLYWERGKIEIDFLPKVNLKHLFLEFKNSKKQISTIINLPKRFIKIFLKVIDLEDKAFCKLNPNELNRLYLLKSYSFSPAGDFGFSRAEVTKGGVDTDEIGLNFESKLTQGLYFLGEVLNVTGELGGYNFQWAISSAFVCAKNME